MSCSAVGVEAASLVEFCCAVNRSTSSSRGNLNIPAEIFYVELFFWSISSHRVRLLRPIANNATASFCACDKSAHCSPSAACPASASARRPHGRRCHGASRRPRCCASSASSATHFRRPGRPRKKLHGQMCAIWRHTSLMRHDGLALSTTTRHPTHRDSLM